MRHRDASVDRIEAGGLGVFLGLRKWAYSHPVKFHLMNVMNPVEHVLELTKLDRVFEFCSVEDMLQLLHFAAATAPPSLDQAKQGIVKDNCKYLVEGKLRGSRQLRWIRGIGVITARYLHPLCPLCSHSLAVFSRMLA